MLQHIFWQKQLSIFMLLLAFRLDKTYADEFLDGSNVKLIYMNKKVLLFLSLILSFNYKYHSFDIKLNSKKGINIKYISNCIKSIMLLLASAASRCWAEAD